MKWTWNDQLSSRRREPACIVACEGGAYRFDGKPISGVVDVLKRVYHKAGKWSHYEYTCGSPDGTVVYPFRQDFETGEFFPQESWAEVCAAFPAADPVELITLIRAEWPDDAAHIDALENAADGSDDECVIVSRHSGAVEWLAQRGVVGRVIEHAAPADVTGRRVVGNLPLHLAALTAQVNVIELPDLTPEQRGKDLSPEEMDAAGARLAAYAVHLID